MSGPLDLVIAGTQLSLALVPSHTELGRGALMGTLRPRVGCGSRAVPAGGRPVVGEGISGSVLGPCQEKPVGRLPEIMSALSGLQFLSLAYCTPSHGLCQPSSEPHEMGIHQLKLTGHGTEAHDRELSHPPQAPRRMHTCAHWSLLGLRVKVLRQWTLVGMPKPGP